MSSSELEITKHEVAIYEKEFREALEAQEDFTSRISRAMQGTTQPQPFEIAVVHFSEKLLLSDRISELATKLVAAYRTYATLLEGYARKRDD